MGDKWNSLPHTGITSASLKVLEGSRSHLGLQVNQQKCIQFQPPFGKMTKWVFDPNSPLQRGWKCTWKWKIVRKMFFWGTEKSADSVFQNMAKSFLSDLASFLAQNGQRHLVRNSIVYLLLRCQPFHVHFTSLRLYDRFGLWNGCTFSGTSFVGYCLLWCLLCRVLLTLEFQSELLRKSWYERLPKALLSRKKVHSNRKLQRYTDSTRKVLS